MGRRNNRQNEAWWTNGDAFNYYFNYCLNVALARVTWELPSEIDTVYLERCLLTDGVALISRDEIIDTYMASKVALYGQMDVYGIPQNRNVVTPNGYTAWRNKNDSVLVWNNLTRTPEMRVINRYARRLFDLDSTMDINARAQKTPVLLHGKESEMLSLENLYMQYDGNYPMIKRDSNNLIDPSQGITVVKTDAPFVVDKMYVYRTQVWNEFLTTMGVANVMEEKKERVIRDEVNRSLGGTLISRTAALQPRERACEDLREVFGIEASVRFNDFAAPLPQPYSEEDDGEVNDDE